MGKVLMTADEFAEMVRKGGGKLRVDRVVVTAGQARFRGSGMLQITEGEFQMDLLLSRTSKAPDDRKLEWKEADYWKLRGVVEHTRHIVATHVSPSARSWSGDLATVTLRFHSLELVESRREANERRRTRELVEELRKKHAESNPLPALGTRKREKKVATSRFIATLVNCKLPWPNAVTRTVRTNPFLGKTSGGKLDTLVAHGSSFDVALIQRETDLQIHLRSKARYRSKNSAEDSKRFQAVLNAIGFCYGFNPWPYRLQQWRDGRQVLDRLTARERLPKTIYAPFDVALGQSDAPPIQLLTRFFAQRSAISEKISTFLFLFRQAGDEPVHLPVKTLAFCSLFEGLVHLLFEELKLEKKLRKDNPDFSAFLAERDRLASELETKGRAGDLSSKRLARLISPADAIRMKDKFKALCEALSLDYAKMKPHYEAWYEERNPLMHGTWRNRDSDFIHQARIAGAINILLLKLMGYSGKVVAMHFGETLSETYRTI